MQTGYSEGGLVEISEGIADEDLVVTVGQVGLKEGAAVTVINAPDEAETAEEQVSDNAQAD